MRSILHIPRSLRPLSLAGSGLPERMRSTAFAFLGLTAAAGLALVAIFAQLSFPLLSPSPLPSEPVEANAVAEAVALGGGPRGLAPGTLEKGGGAPGPRDSKGARGEVTAAEHGEGGAGAVGSPSPVATPEGDNGGIEGGSTGTPPSTPTPPAPPAPGAGAAPSAEPTPEPVPAASSKSKAGAAKSKPAKATAKPTKTKAAKSESKAAKEEAKAVKEDAKAEAKAVKAESKAPKAEAGPEPSSKPSAPPPPEDAPAGKGKALGHSK